MKRRVAILAALAFSIGLHAFLILAGRSGPPPLSAEAARVPDKLYVTHIVFPRHPGEDPLADFFDSLELSGTRLTPPAGAPAH